MKFWLTVGGLVLVMCGSAQAGFQHLTAHHQPKVWVLPSKDESGNVIAIHYRHRTFTGHPHKGCKWPLRMGDIRAQVRLCYPKGRETGRFSLRYSAPAPRSFYVTWR